MRTATIATTTVLRKMRAAVGTEDLVTTKKSLVHRTLTAAEEVLLSSERERCYDLGK